MNVAASRPAVFDASAVLALIQGEPGAKKLYPLLPDAVVSAVSLAEVLGKLVTKGVPLPEARAAFDALHIEVAEFDASQAITSASYVRKGISLGDRCFLAAAGVGGTGWTSDHALAGIAGAQTPALKFFR